MTVPGFQEFLRPLLARFGDEGEHNAREFYDELAAELHVDEEGRRTLLPSGTATLFDNRAAWARTYLKKAGWIENVRRGFYRITQDGLRALKEHPKSLSVRDLKEVETFREWHDRPSEATPNAELTHAQGLDSTEKSPEEELQALVLGLRRALADEVLERLRTVSPEFFERIVVQVLVAMGYGGSIADAGRAIGRSGDEGIDGVIKEDRLGLDVLYVQAKRWSSSVGRPQIHAFVGALHGKHARKGILITTSTFTQEARKYADGIETKVVLLDGVELANLMIECDVGVTPLEKFETKRLDSDFFEES